MSLKERRKGGNDTIESAFIPTSLSFIFAFANATVHLLHEPPLNQNADIGAASPVRLPGRCQH